MKEYYIDSDNNGHKYIIPYDKLDDWSKFLELPDEDKRSWKTPEYAIRVDGGRVVFKEWKIK